ncbi:MAG: bifunctional diaminohydroxyphosphoribosylaminopyrimidine deaminase/5-amino-6-(5-phosphoribosylamino)uracil reductase RibD [bacterium]|nr:bifunctional diaminohydroxyphosphoribosylaminopyrimidine deaminase/5-amino-6-(5-phosphoribosylamino)uracil reductase RibD [bacterium]
MFKHEIYFMRLALDLAQKGFGNVWPNPMVGAVIVKNSQIIGKGFHSEYGKDHAEVAAIKSVIFPDSLLGSTMYVNLEPCCHYGNTPPCVNAIIAAGIGKVVIANIDYNPKVFCNGINILKSSGVEVDVGVLEEAGWELNERFFKKYTIEIPSVLAI